MHPTKSLSYSEVHLSNLVKNYVFREGTVKNDRNYYYYKHYQDMIKNVTPNMTFQNSEITMFLLKVWFQ